MIHLSSNIRLLRKRKGRTQEEVALVVGLKRPTYCGLELGNSLPGIESLVSLSDYFGVAVDTLLRVDLSKLSAFHLSELERGNDVFIRGSNIRVLATTTNDRDEENIELVPVKAKAGYTTGYADPGFISELPRFHLPFLSKSRKYRTFQISGDSMLPIPDGAWVTGEFVQDWHTIHSGKPYIILTLDDGIVCKIADNLLQDEGKLRLYSLNTIYEPYDVPVVNIREVWRFVHLISTEVPEMNPGEGQLLQTVMELRDELGKIRKQIK
jgi:transcriptional regulator with XRE-family HTH domain